MKPKPNMLSCLLALVAVCILTSLSNGQPPPPAQFCPPGFAFDSANCFLTKAPDFSNPVIDDNRFVYTKPASPAKCHIGFTYESDKNLCKRQVPAGYSPFIYQNGFYVSWNGHFAKEMVPQCPTGSSFDSVNCFYGKAPIGKLAQLSTGNTQFVFDNSVSPISCSTIGFAAFGSTCVKNVPSGYSPFVYDNGWYVKPNFVASGNWLAKNFLFDEDKYLRKVCRTDGPTTPYDWKLAWSDEFSNIPANFHDNDELKCTRRPGWGSLDKCIDEPPNWKLPTTANGWSPLQIGRFGGLLNLDKTIWSVYQSAYIWDIWGATGNPFPERTSALLPDNISIINTDGFYALRIKTSEHPTEHFGDGYCCGKQTGKPPGNTGEPGWYSMDCPYSGAIIESATGLPWTSGNDPNSPDPGKRYVGKTVSYGRIEFKARVKKIGHGGWPNLWLFTSAESALENPGGGGFEMDVLEFGADTIPDDFNPPNDNGVAKGIRDQIKRQSSTYGMAWQTAWYYPPPTAPDPKPFSLSIGTPIGLNEWHVYAVEYEDKEVRFYIDNCLTSRITDGQMVKDRWDGVERELKIPKGLTFNILIGNYASAASYFPQWYRAYRKKTDLCGNGYANCENADKFESTEFEVDYVRYYIAAHWPPAPPPKLGNNTTLQQRFLQRQPPGASTLPPKKVPR